VVDIGDEHGCNWDIDDNGWDDRNVQRGRIHAKAPAGFGKLGGGTPACNTRALVATEGGRGRGIGAAQNLRGGAVHNSVFRPGIFGVVNGRRGICGGELVE
jgi:hypothetical protein